MKCSTRSFRIFNQLKNSWPCGFKTSGQSNRPPVRELPLKLFFSKSINTVRSRILCAPATIVQGDLHVTWGCDSSAVVTLSSVRFESTQTLGNLSSQPIAACRAPAAARSPSHPGPRGAARCAALGARTAPPGRNSWGERCGGARLNALFRKPALAVDRRREGARLVPFFGDGQS